MTTRQWNYAKRNHDKGMCRSHSEVKIYRGGLCEPCYIKWLCYMKNRRLKIKLLKAEFKQAITPNES